jgi:hypothetical protein
MEVRLSKQVAASLVGVQAALEYPSPKEVVTLILDARRFGWDLKLSAISQPASSIRLRLNKRHEGWVKDFAHLRGISASSAINLIVSEYLAGIKSIEWEGAPPTTQISTHKPFEATDKPKGAALLSSLKR